MTALPAYHSDIALATHQVITAEGQILRVCALCIDHTCARDAPEELPAGDPARTHGCECNHDMHFKKVTS